MSSKTIALFAKAPILGAVKTRLSQALGDAGCLALHRDLIAHSWAQLRLAAAESDADLALWASAPAQEFESLVSHYYCQQGADLGERLRGCAQHYLPTLSVTPGRETGSANYPEFSGAQPGSVAAKLLIVGADCPFVDSETVAEAFTALDTAPVVFVPAHDGGYVALGLSACIDPVFENIPWGSSDVMAASRDQLRAAAIPWRELTAQQDIDEEADLPSLAILPDLQHWSRSLR